MSSGGAERQLVGLAIMLKQKGYEVEVCTYKTSNFYVEVLRSNGIIHLSLSTNSAFKRLLGTIKHIRGNKSDVVISYLEQPSSFCCIAKLFAKFKLIVSERNTTQKLTRNTRFRFFLYRFADWIVPNSYTQRNFILKHYPSYEGKVRTITNYTDIRQFVPAEQYSDNKVVRFVVAARITPQKNIPLFADALSILKNEGYSFVVDWYGNPLNKDYGDYCKNYIQKKGLESEFVFYRATSNILKEYQTADCFVLPSKYEGYPNVVCEAMSCGLPILCSNVCDNPNIVKDGVNGLLFDPNNSSDISAKMSQFLKTDINIILAMRRKSRELSESLFSEERFIDKYVDIINNMDNKYDVLIINDNNLGYLGGERESQLVILNGISPHFKTAVIQPGIFDEKIPGVDVYYLTKSKRLKYLIKNPFAFGLYILKVGKLVKKLHPRIVHSQSQVSFFMMSLLKRFHLVPKDIILLHTDRGLYTKYNNFFRWLFQFSFKYLNLLVTTTDFNRRSWENANQEKGFQLYYRVIGNTAGRIYETIDEKKLIPHDEIRVGFAGRYCDWKGWPLAEEICAKVNESTSQSVFYMYVSCFDETAEIETKKMFKRMTDLLGNRFVGKINVPFADMEQFYYDIDVYVLTSWPLSESFGRTIVEAMSRKNAILTTNAGGSVEVVDNPATVCETADEFSKIIIDWHENHSKLNSEKERCFKRVHDCYTLANNVDNYISLYNLMLKN